MIPSVHRRGQSRVVRWNPLGCMCLLCSCLLIVGPLMMIIGIVFMVAPDYRERKIETYNQLVTNWTTGGRQEQFAQLDLNLIVEPQSPSYTAVSLAPHPGDPDSIYPSDQKDPKILKYNNYFKYTGSFSLDVDGSSNNGEIRFDLSLPLQQFTVGFRPVGQEGQFQWAPETIYAPLFIQTKGHSSTLDCESQGGVSIGGECNFYYKLTGLCFKLNITLDWYAYNTTDTGSGGGGGSATDGSKKTTTATTPRGSTAVGYPEVHIDDDYGGYGCSPSGILHPSSASTTLQDFPAPIYTLIVTNGNDPSDEGSTLRFSFDNLVVTVRSEYDPFVYAQAVTNGGQASFGFNRSGKYYYGGGVTGVGAVLTVPGILLFIAIITLVVYIWTMGARHDKIVGKNSSSHASGFSVGIGRVMDFQSESESQASNVVPPEYLARKRAGVPEPQDEEEEDEKKQEEENAKL